MEKTLVVGGSGFIGSAIQREVLKSHDQEAFTFSYHTESDTIDSKLEPVRLDLLNAEKNNQLRDYSKAVYVAGNANHGLAKRNPMLDLDLNTRAYLNFMMNFRGSLVLLSSQAVYYGLEGEILEDVEHVSTIPYGLSKQAAEAYAKYFLEEGRLSKLWIFRLAYAYGMGEKDHRLIPRCAKAVREKGKVTLFGGGSSFINPLPVEFVSSTLLRASEDQKRKLEITNLNCPNKITVKDMILLLNNVTHFDFELQESGEEWPVRFYGNIENLASYLRSWNVEFPVLQDSLKNYFIDLVQREKNG